MKGNPRLIIAAVSSGCGKTTITMGIIKSLVERGLKVQPYKSGPDYIDPGFHTMAAGRRCGNLDTMLLSREKTLELFARHAEGADISVIEGVMGLFDGAFAEKEKGSTSHLAKTLDCPVVLVIDVKAMSRSAGAIALGFKNFDKDLHLSGFILNRVGSERHFLSAKESIEKATLLPVFGYLPKDVTISVPERHLGLVPVQEEMDPNVSVSAGKLVEKSIDIEALIKTAYGAPPLPEFQKTIFINPDEFAGVTVACAFDEAFHFYYRDNIDLFSFLGAKVIPFSPLTDKKIPEETDLVYIGGGYPEVFAEKLALNTALLEDLRKKTAEGLSIYAECGGLMYLTESITCFDGKVYPMAGVLPGRTVMEQKRMALGYCDVDLVKPTILGAAGAALKGHLFHWSSMVSLPPEYPYAFRIRKNGKVIYDGIHKGNVLASYVHINFATNPDWIKQLLIHSKNIEVS